jgi:hypothetical protein
MQIGLYTYEKRNFFVETEMGDADQDELKLQAFYSTFSHLLGIWQALVFYVSCKWLHYSYIHKVATLQLHTHFADKI